MTAPLTDLADWGALGAIVGERARGYWSVPLFKVSGSNPTSDELKHLGASLASYGSMAMFHMVGVTPEAAAAPRQSQAMEVGAAEIDAFFSRSQPEGGPINLIVFTAPQLSFFELRSLARLLAGKRVHPDVHMLITTNAMVHLAAQREGIVSALEEAGAMLLSGTCWYIMDPAHMRREFGWSSVLTNSAKLANIIPAHGYRPVLRRTADCVEAAVSGSLVPLER